ncbi:Protein NRT1/ PTR FAMILY 5.10 [Camellia lanceoleosa]|uniref:Protein NRT1/ PTR FAMILY 5.10 n=1 Tax=Camellia lanceoleosa TaxID=1840588 RepID=A0ACC0GQN9_9ERIC|nr:Protein NRT1/ PTR FAMILY 5.10 [Camellia lanceoleosa]
MIIVVVAVLWFGGRCNCGGKAGDGSEACGDVMVCRGLICSNRMAVYVLNNSVTFLTHIWKLKLKHAVAIMNIKGGAASIMGLVEAALIDAYLGHAGMLLITSVLYNIGLGFLVMSVPNRFFSKGVKSCPAGEKLCSSKLTASPFYWGLALIVLAKDGQGICLRAVTFGKIKFKRGPPETKGTEFNYGNEDQTPQGQGHNQKTPRGPKKRTTLTDHCRMVFEQRIERMNGRHSSGMKVGLGMLAALACCKVVWLVEYIRLKSLKEHGLLGHPDAIAPISVFWLSPQFVLMGIMDGLARDGMEDFFKYQVPESMRKRYALVLTEAVIGWGKIQNTGFIMILDVVVKKLRVEDGSWIVDTVNQSRLDLFYAALVVVSIANLFIFAYVASFYTYRDFPEEKMTKKKKIHMKELKLERSKTRWNQHLMKKLTNT